MKNTTVAKFAAIVVASFAGLSSAVAGPTVVRPAPAGELGAAGIFNHVYGGSFVANGINFTNGTVTATRVSDDFSGVLDDSDALWSGGRFEARTIAKFSLSAQTFGHFDGASGGSFNSLFDASGFGLSVGGAGSIDLSGQTYRWGRSGDSSTHSSLASDNADGRDHLVTYRIDGLGDNNTTFALFWEDLDKNGLVGKNHSYCDYNDLVIELRADACEPGANPVPLPPALIPAAAMLGVMGYIRRRRATKA